MQPCTLSTGRNEKEMINKITERIYSARDMVSSLLLEMRRLAEIDGCDEEALTEALTDIDRDLAMTKSAIMLSGHRATFSEDAEARNPLMETMPLC